MYHEYYDMYNVYADFVREDFLIKSATPKEYGQKLARAREEARKKSDMYSVSEVIKKEVEEEALLSLIWLILIK